MGDNNNSTTQMAATDAASAIRDHGDAGQEATPSSLESSPEPSTTEIVQDPAQPQKRKGGRKPIYATSEERKQRNRQAQAAFRERRTEYIKQLETTIKHHEETLQTLQQSHRSAADECLMLRYKNSLLERILLEKGIDVQAELQMKTGSPALGHTYIPHHAPAPMAAAPLQRTALNRQHARRSGQVYPPRVGPGAGAQSDLSFSARSPQGHPTPSSHASSPTALSTQSPAALQPGAMTPPASVIAGGQQQQYGVPQPPRSRYVMQHPPQHRGPAYSAPNGVSSITEPTNGVPGSASAFYPSPFQKHIEQLGNTDQEYDAQPTSSSMLETESEANEQAPVQAPEPPQFPAANPYHATHAAQQHADHHGPAKGNAQENDRGHPGENQIPGMNQIFDPYDPMLDADPFGLSASMHFSTDYGFQHPPQR
ncbi:hypothetical protein D6D12_01280 [Aureobasidium pullulans]|uniref:BZIP domain-containing protein n=1 Tax=Aureobasidium pullulans TaxID=5580 RepID=A0A4V4IVI3_AURPU|nr:hypothetical protein D6D15_05282 [Aureobasidium pullulans]THX33771.1 hypothetical protein D6D12_01280 [Aureobasidium pullulans]